jgi:hypothetical protein
MLKHNKIIRIISSINVYKLLISLILAVFVVIIGYERISLPDRKPLPIHVTQTSETMDYGEGVCINRILLDGMEYNLASIPLVKGWEYKESEKLLLSKSLTPETIVIDLPKAKDVRIIFRAYEGAVSISEGSQVVNIRLDNSVLNSNIYVTHTNVIGILEVLPWLILFCILLVVIFYIMISLFCKLVYKLGGKKRDAMLWGGIIIYRIFYYLSLNIDMLFNDSRDYISYNMNELFTEFILFDRVPLYPIIIAAIRLIGGNELYLYYVVLLQIIFSAISVIYFYKLVCMIAVNKKISSAITIFYACSPAVLGFDQCILTESLSISGTVFFIYFITSYIINNDTKYMTRTILTAFILTWLRPTFLMFFVLIAIFLVIQAFTLKKDQKLIIKPCVTLIICSIFILVYVIRFDSIYGYYSISRLKVRQDLYVSMNKGFYKNSTNEEFIAIIDREIDKGKANYVPSNDNVNNKNDDLDIAWNTMTAVQEYYNYDDVRIMELVNEAKENSRKEYIFYIMELIKENAGTRYDGYVFLMQTGSISYDIIYMSSKFFGILNFMHIYILIVMEGILVVDCFRRKKKELWIHVGFFVFMPAIIISTFIATNGEFMRTSVAVVPFAYCSITYCLNMLIPKQKD